VEEEELRQELEKARKEFEELENDFKDVKMQFEVAQISEGKAEIKLKRVNQNLEALKIEVEALESENHDQRNCLEELERSAMVKVPIRMVKETICKMCLMKVSLTHAVMFKNVLPMADEKRTPTLNDDMQRKTCACNIA
jgi:septal ring factor EnvC (AmiA/AmiB activator)